MIVTKNENNLFNILESQIYLTVNEDEGYIDLSVTTDSPHISANFK